jgi:hypothetical protein
LSSSAVQGQPAAHYRNFQLGGDLASVAALAGVAASGAKTIHVRPAILQELQWRRPYTLSSETAVDPVQRITFSFYNDQLFRVVIDYDRDRTEGLIDADLVEAISVMYGATVKPVLKANPPLAAIEEESGMPVARWGNAEYAAVLYRSSYASSFRMIVTSSRLNALAQRAETQALRLDEREAPQRERVQQKKDADDARASKEKARLANKAAFRP